MSYGQFI